MDGMEDNTSRREIFDRRREIFGKGKYLSVEEMEKYQSIRVSKSNRFHLYTVILSVGKRSTFRETWLA